MAHSFIEKCIGLCLLPAFVLGSCQQRLYFPDRANAPMLSEARELKLGVSGKLQVNHTDSAHGNGGASSAGVDLAFAPVNHFGITASWRDMNCRRIDEQNGNFVDGYGGVFTGNRWELGAGYFTTFGRVGIAEAYAGYGDGSLSRRGYETPERDYDTRYRRFFIQADAGIAGPVVNAGGGLRIAALRYYNFTSPTTPDLRYQILDLSGAPRDVQAETYVFCEPFINAEVGWKVLRLSMQMGWAGQIGGARIGGNTPFYLSMGGTLELKPSYFRKGAFWQRAEQGRNRVRGDNAAAGR